jgi:hypothetical protein
MTILNMPKWKSKVLNAVAWMLGMRGEHVACITFNFDYTDPQIINKLSSDRHECQDCGSKSCAVCNDN